MIIHYNKADGHLGAGKFVCSISGQRTALFNTEDGFHFQVNNSDIVKKLNKAPCFRCLGLKEVFAFKTKKYLKCPTCKSPEELKKETYYKIEFEEGKVKRNYL